MRESVKHRLIGAAVLAAIAVLFLPSFFKDRQQYQVDTSSQIPGRPSITAVDFNDPVRPEGIEPAPAPETMFLPDERESMTDAQIPPAEQPVAARQSTSSPQSIENPAVPALPLNAQGLPDTWVIQVASLSGQVAANKLRDQLQAEGHKAYVRSVEGSNATTYRVFIGPKQNRTEAVAIKNELDKRLKVNSLILPFKP